MYKYPLDKNVLEAALDRINWVFDNLPRVCVSFSGGKDSTIMLHLTAQQARKKGKKIHLLFIDWEAQFTCTIQHVNNMKQQYADVIEKCWWVALPLTTQNALSQFQPEWQCWEPGVNWVRQPPEEAITDPGYFDFYQPGMTFEAFVRAFSDWFAQNRPAAVMVGIRADESYNRFLTIANARKKRFADDKPWTTIAPGGHAWYIYPIYDWKTADIWTWFAKTGSDYNPLYNLMFQAGVPPRYMRICEPFGPEQRQGCGSTMLSSRNAGRPCANGSAVYVAVVSTPGRITTFMATAKSSSLTISAGKSTPCCCSTVCRKKRLSITATKSRFICTGIKRKGWRIFPIPRKVTLEQKISPPGDASAKSF
jgi:predicted phosphoadenosine phosphosulfate sulfurtransferase